MTDRNDRPEMLDANETNLLRNIVSGNIRKIMEALGVTQSRFADMTAVAESSVSNYLSGRLPQLDYMVGLCRILKKRGIDVTLDLLIDERFDPMAALDSGNRVGRGLDRVSVANEDYFGNYICYYYNQNKAAPSGRRRRTRALKYGVISIYNSVSSLTGDVVIKAKSRFFDSDDAEEAYELKSRLDRVFEKKVPLGIRNIEIEDIYREESSSYEGVVHFSGSHFFIDIKGDVFKDRALMVLHAPDKRTDTPYIGGLGTVASVTGGANRMPVAQKIILSKYKLRASGDEIADKLSVSSAAASMEAEAKAIGEFCTKLYADDSGILLSETDRTLLIRHRLEKLANDYVEQQFCCLGCVTQEDDIAIYELIEQSAN